MDKITERTVEINEDVAFQERSIALTEQYTNEFGQIIDREVPMTLSNAEYGARTSSLLIALTRQLARCAAAFGHANGQSPDDVQIMVMKMFGTNYNRAMEALTTGEGKPN